MKWLALLVGLVGAAVVPHECGAQIYNDPGIEYTERSIMIFPGGGNANDINAAIQTIDPWPPYAGNTRIPNDGRSAVQGVRRMYSKPDPFFTGGQSAGQSSGGTGGTSSGGGLQSTQAVPSGF